MSRRSDYTPEEGTKLTRRLDEMRVNRGVPHEVVEQEMLDDMERELRRLARDYDGSERKAKELLEALVVARECGVKACDEIELALAQRLRKSA